MTYPVALIQIVGGVLYLLMGGDLLVRGAMALARRTRVSPMVIGLTIVALGTSAPELVVTLLAIMGGYPELAISNVVGSNIANVLVVMAIPAMIYPLSCAQKSARADSVFMLLITATFLLLVMDGALNRADGFILLSGLVIFLALQARRESDIEPELLPDGRLPFVLGLPNKTITIAALIAAGIVMLPLGADLLINGAVGLGGRLGISNQVLGLTVVALSTSVPELATTVIAALKRQADLAVGNVIGSNVLNILGIMGAASLTSLRELIVPERFLVLDLPLMFGATLVVTLVALRGGAVGRKLGVTMLAIYVIYSVMLYTTLA